MCTRATLCDDVGQICDQPGRRLPTLPVSSSQASGDGAQVDVFVVICTITGTAGL